MSQWEGPPPATLTITLNRLAHGHKAGLREPGDSLPTQRARPTFPKKPPRKLSQAQVVPRASFSGFLTFEPVFESGVLTIHDVLQWPIRQETCLALGSPGTTVHLGQSLRQFVSRFENQGSSPWCQILPPRHPACRRGRSEQDMSLNRSSEQERPSRVRL